MEVERGSDLDWGMEVLWREYFEDLPNLADIASVEEAETGDQLRGVEHLLGGVLGMSPLGHVQTQDMLERPGEN